MTYDVFISASKEDKATADAACAVLEAEGMRCWIAPRDIPPGQGWGEGILAGINQSKMMVLVFSSHANGSHHVQREVERAVNRGIPIIPFRVENVPPQRGLEYFLSLPNWLDAFQPPLEPHLRRLASSAKSLLKESAPVAGAAPILEKAPIAQPNRIYCGALSAPSPYRRMLGRPGTIAALLLGVAVLVGAGTLAWEYFGIHLVPIDATSGEIVVGFGAAETASAPGYMVAADPYLHAAVPISISVDNREPAESRIVFVNNLGLYEGRAVAPTKSQNFLTQTNTGNVPASFTLRFAEPVAGVSFLVPRVYPATKSGITFPAWRAVALSASGEELGSASQALARRFADIPAQSFQLSAPAFDGIAAVKFSSDPRLGDKPFAAFSAILIEEIKLTPRQ